MPKQNQSAKGNPAAIRMNNPTRSLSRMRAAIVAPTSAPSSATANDQRSARMALAIALRKEYPDQFSRITRLVATVAIIMQRGIVGEPTNTTHPLDYAAYAYGRHGGTTERNYLLSQIRNELVK